MYFICIPWISLVVSHRDFCVVIFVIFKFEVSLSKEVFWHNWYSSSVVGYKEQPIWCAQLQVTAIHCPTQKKYLIQWHLQHWPTYTLSATAKVLGEYNRWSINWPQRVSNQVPPASTVVRCDHRITNVWIALTDIGLFAVLQHL